MSQKRPRTLLILLLAGALAPGSASAGGVFCQCSSYIAHLFLGWPLQDLGPANGKDMGPKMEAAGWSRVGGAPQPGDVAVMTNSGYGHVTEVVGVGNGTFLGHGANQGGGYEDHGCSNVNTLTFSMRGSTFYRHGGVASMPQFAQGGGGSAGPRFGGAGETPQAGPTVSSPLPPAAPVKLKADDFPAPEAPAAAETLTAPDSPYQIVVQPDSSVVVNDADGKTLWAANSYQGQRHSSGRTIRR